MQTKIEKTSRIEEFSKNPEKALWKLAVPVMLGMSLHTIYNITDMIFIGRVSSSALAALAFNMPLFFLVIALMMGFGSAITSVISRYIGSGNKSGADNCALHGLALALVISTGFAVTGIFLGREMLAFIGAPETLIDQAWSYLGLISIGVPFMVTANAFASILSGEGDTRLPMMLIGLGTLLNIFLDPLFIFIYDMGLRGAAAATVISQFVVFTIFLYLLFLKQRSYISLSLVNFSFNSKILQEILSIGIPASGSMTIMAFGGLVFNRILIHYSESAVAAYQVVGRIDMFVFIPMMAISSSLVTLVGMFYGAGDYTKVSFIIKQGMKRAFMVVTLVASLIFFSAPYLISVFTKDREIGAIATGYLQIISFFYPLVAIAMTSGRSMQGLGKGLPVLVITSTRILLVSAPLSLLFAFVFHKPVEWVWYSIALSVVVSSALGFTWLRRVVRRLGV